VTPRGRRAEAFVETYFNGCPAHQREARGAFEALEKIAGRPLLAVTADTAVGAVIGPGADVSYAFDPSEMTEHQMALEEELSDPILVEEALDTARADHVLRTLLGPAADPCTWDPETVWPRSLRGIVNERVRHRGPCTCANPERPRRKGLTRVH
jgi:hypothetical protein